MLLFIDWLTIFESVGIPKKGQTLRTNVASQGLLYPGNLMSIARLQAANISLLVPVFFRCSYSVKYPDIIPMVFSIKF